MLRFAALFLGWSSILAACSDNGPLIKYQDYDQALQQAKCERAARCGLFPDEASCMGFARVVANDSLAGAIAANKVHYDGGRALLCVDAISKQSCDLTADDSHIMPVACQQMFVGAIQGGDNCSINEECASGLCNLPDAQTCPETGCCVGTCKPVQQPAAAGGGCARNIDCNAGLVCGGDQLCHKPAGEGGACFLDAECTTGMGCVGASGNGPGACHTLPHDGQACPYLRCADESEHCDQTSHTCQHVGLAGAPCPVGDECGRGYECTSGQCTAVPTLGMACARQCGGDAWCQPNDQTPGKGTCIKPLANGAVCDGFDECESFYCQDQDPEDLCLPQYVCF
jgi:hypothetical protein